jgi:hypothetical protein
MSRPIEPTTRVAYMYDDDMQRTYEVVKDSEGNFWVKDTRPGFKWGQVAIHSSWNPTVDDYLNSCHNNFGWRIERTTDIQKGTW